MSDTEKPKKDPEVKQKFVVRTPTDVQRIKLEKLMANPTKEIIIQPIQGRKSSDPSVPSFVRNVMGSSAGAGSGEFHVYRHLRRKEFARQKQIEQKSKREEMDEAFENKLLQNKSQAEERTARKRAKRLKKKQKAKQRKLNPKPAVGNESESSDEESGDGDDAETHSANEADVPGEKGAGNDDDAGPKAVDIADGGATEEKDDEKASNDDDSQERQGKTDEPGSS